jgi:hypothetical protein
MTDSVEAGGIAQALDQISYTADEIEALVPLIRRVPLAVLGAELGLPVDATHDDNSWSIAIAFEAIRARDRRLADVTSTGTIPAASDCRASRIGHASELSHEYVCQLLEEICATRRIVVAEMGRLAQTVSAGQMPVLGARLFELVHDDAEILREIAYALHAGPVTGQVTSPASGRGEG